MTFWGWFWTTVAFVLIVWATDDVVPFESRWKRILVFLANWGLIMGAYAIIYQVATTT